MFVEPYCTSGVSSGYSGQPQRHNNTIILNSVKTAVLASRCPNVPGTKWFDTELHCRYMFHIPDFPDSIRVDAASTCDWDVTFTKENV
ncbi:hypothetical protein DPMN_191236 [Dreissena polymorpha]|uniref:Uncharacterized protein n=1 Tax=Dreissena polymorpha TaxID=45954 RepID=A0A9D4BE77_DREPO|nr:hypothetical protein DPMN_191236 [Dreissena polymorpha]